MSNPIVGVYVITNTVTGKQYVGASKHLDERWEQHRVLLTSGKHHSPALQADWHTYGRSAFTFTVIEEVSDPHALYHREADLIRALTPAYNVALPVNAATRASHIPGKRTVYELRVAAFLRQFDVAYHLKISISTVTALEQRTQLPSILLAQKIAKFFGVSVDDIDWEKR